MAGTTALSGKLQGLKSTFHYTPPGGSAAVRFKSLAGWTMKISSPKVDVSDHDSVGYTDTLPGLASVDVTVTGMYFEGDATQQGILTALIAAINGTGGVLAGTFEPINAVGGLVYSGNFRVTDYTHSATSNNEAQKLDITLVNSGAITVGTQATQGA